MGSFGVEVRASLRAIRSVTFLYFDLRDPRLHQSLNQHNRQRLVCGEVDGPFGGGESLNLAKFFAYYGARLVELEGFEPSTS